MHGPLGEDDTFGPSRPFSYCLHWLGSGLLVVNQTKNHAEQANPMADHSPSQTTHQTPEQAHSRLVPDVACHAVGGVRTDLTTLLPIFAERPNSAEFEATVDGYRLTIYSDDEGIRLPTSLDHKILTLLAAHIRDVIRAGGTPSRQIYVHRQELLNLLYGSNNVGGADYKRLIERLNRLFAVRIVAEHALDENTSRRRHFRWIESFEEDFQHTGRGKELVRLRITLSTDAFRWITRHEGFDLSHQEFTAISRSGASVSRVFDICLARLVYARGEDIYIQIDDLRRRVPISSSLRHFKSRTLKAALDEIETNQGMARLLSARLVRQTEAGFEPVVGRAPLDSLYVHVSRGSAPLPPVNCLIPDADIAMVDPESPRAGEAFATMLHEQFELFGEDNM